MNMPDRIGGGLWPHPRHLSQECVDAVVDYLGWNKWFPREWEPTTAASSVALRRSARHHTGCIFAEEDRAYVKGGV
jgi:hypothetical protein